MQGRIAFLEELIEKVESLILFIEDQESVEPDLSIVRDVAEQLRDEVESLL